MRVYLDNAATTALDPKVIDAMLPYLHNHFGNPSSIHSYGRETRAAIEKARKQIAGLFHVSPGEIFFTSGGTEANNMALQCSVRDLGVTHIITSQIEHHAVTHTVEALKKENKIKLTYVKLEADGSVDYNDLEELLKASSEKTLVSLMHANNEIGVLLDIDKVSELCETYDACFHCDTVQTIAHYNLDLQKTKIHFISCAAHKFHGPKGVGFIYVNADALIKPLIYGGAQERNMRAGTENLYGIIGLAKALEIAYKELEETKQYISSLRAHLKKRLNEEIPGIIFNSPDNGLYTVLNVNFPASEKNELLLFNLDIAGIAASGGSACSSGSNIGSHVIAHFNREEDSAAVRFSFSKFNTKEEIDFVVDKMKEMMLVTVQ
ncbi:MAG: cysteine desulfurase [Fimbriimonadaceae bacterium]|nr:cysteine desulfurase [Chitinophagales bacterium]